MKTTATGARTRPVSIKSSSLMQPDANQQYYPESDGDDESTGHNTSKCLVPSNIKSVGFHRIIECTVRHKEQNKWRHYALGNRPSEHSLVEQHVVVAGSVQLGIAYRVRLVHVLHRSRTTSYGKHFAASALLIWNSLPINVRDFSEQFPFKSESRIVSPSLWDCLSAYVTILFEYKCTYSTHTHTSCSACILLLLLCNYIRCFCTALLSTVLELWCHLFQI